MQFESLLRSAFSNHSLRLYKNKISFTIVTNCILATEVNKDCRTDYTSFSTSTKRRSLKQKNVKDG